MIVDDGAEPQVDLQLGSEVEILEVLQAEVAHVAIFVLLKATIDGREVGTLGVDAHESEVSLPNRRLNEVIQVQAVEVGLLQKLLAHIGHDS